VALRRTTPSRARPGPAVLLAVLAAAVSVPAAAQQAARPDSLRSGNPIVRDIFTADPAALVHDGRLYIFTGRDEAAATYGNFLMREWHVYSSVSPSNQPEAWEHHGALLTLDAFEWADANAWASEVVQGPDGRFYWYVSVRWRGAAQGTDRMSIGVAVADHPLGPYRDAIGAPLITSAMPNPSAHNIDPTVIVDREHGIYLYWGSFWQARYVKLMPNMIELDGEFVAPEGLPGFWEAPWLFERGGTWYNAYASNRNLDDDGCVTSDRYACIRYSTASHPAGPWTHRGIVLGQVSSTTNHPAIIEFPTGSDQWWMVYHTADLPEGGTFRRSVAIDRLHFNDDGTMKLVVQTRYDPPVRKPVPSRNAALTATATCSFTSAWEDCRALNSGRDPDSSNIPGPSVGTRWGTWPQPGPHWIQYEWSLPVRIDASEIYWFQDSGDAQEGGVKRPAAWSLQYWNGSEWALLPKVPTEGTELNRYNRVEFVPVTTTRLRATLEGRAGAGGTGALQWKVLSPDPSAVDPVEVSTPLRTPPQLPATVTLRYADGTSVAARVWWREYDEAGLGRARTFTVRGVVENTILEAEARVTVTGG
jgi:hypothetical protein